MMKREGNVPKRTFKEDLGSIFKTESKKPYLILLVMVFIRSASSLYMGLFEKYMDNVGILNQNQITLVFLATVFMVIFAYLINGLLADRIGRKPLLYLWSILAPISVLLWVFGVYSPSNAFLIVLIGFSLSHISFWGSWGILRLITIELLPTDRRGTGVGFRGLIGSIGGTFGLFLGGAVILLAGLGTTFTIFVMGNLILIPLTYFFIKETKGVELSEIK
jgi:MFS family permease